MSSGLTPVIIWLSVLVASGIPDMALLDKGHVVKVVVVVYQVALVVGFTSAIWHSSQICLASGNHQMVSENARYIIIIIVYCKYTKWIGFGTL